jgi:hypothetical protein
MGFTQGGLVYKGLFLFSSAGGRWPELRVHVRFEKGFLAKREYGNGVYCGKRCSDVELEKRGFEATLKSRQAFNSPVRIVRAVIGQMVD